jgi:integrase
MRPGEVTAMRACDLDTTGRIWLYTPADHKTAYAGHERTIHLGPKARKLLKPFLAGRPTTAYLFSPAEADAERRAERAAARKTPLSCGNRPGTNRQDNPKRKPGERYTTMTYHQAVRYACDQADKAARRKAKMEVPADQRLVPRWHPHQLRHNYATAVRKKYGIETARVMLGHPPKYSGCSATKRLTVRFAKPGCDRPRSAPGNCWQ